MTPPALSVPLLICCSLAAAGAAAANCEVEGPEKKDGIETYVLTSDYQEMPCKLFVLLPDKLDKKKQYKVLYLLPALGGGGGDAADGMLEARKLDLANTHDVICVGPGFSRMPWYADLPDNPKVRYDSYLPEVIVPFIDRTYPTIAKPEGRLLVGFSKSGIGAVSLLLRHPDVFGRAGAWDAPLIQSHTRPEFFGPQEHFLKNYHIPTLLNRRLEMLRDKPARIAITGNGWGGILQAHNLMDQLEIPHHFNPEPRGAHEWKSGWLGPLVDVLMADDMTKVKPVLTADWPCWRGPYHNGRTASTRRWTTRWPAEGPKKLWTTKIGQGYSSPVVSGDRVFIGGWGDPRKGGKRDWDTLYCLSADTGEILWQTPFPNTAKNIGTAATPTVEGSVVYAVSNACAVAAFDVQTGKEIWRRDLSQEGVKPIQRRCWSAAPLVEGDLLILNGGTSGIALEKATGKVAWKSDPDVVPYVSPVPIDVDGQHLVLMMTGKNVVAVKPADGSVVFGSTRKEISWKITIDNLFGDPVVRGGDVELSGIWLKLKDGKVVWDRKGDRKRNYNIASTCQPILYHGCIYGSHMIENKGSLTKLQQFSTRCRDWATGEVKWEQVGLCGQQIMVDDKLLILGIDGSLVVVQATPEKYTELARTSVFPGYKDGDQMTHCLVAPAFADGRVYLRKGDTVVCLDLRRD